jgi:hypothetical protein
MTDSYDVLFFGCVGFGTAGHFLRAPGWRHVPSRCVPDSLQPTRLDGQLAPKDPHQREGRARLHHLDGWTVVAWWDRSVDTRMNSNSALLVRGTHSFAAVLLAAADAFPELLPRFGLLRLVP